MMIKLPENVNFIIKRLNSLGFHAHVVGGCVRDSLLGLTPHDWDICTSAKPGEIIKCFSKLQRFDSGLKHGTVSVVIDGEVYEITTYRVDGEYSDNRRPDSVTFTDSLIDDLARRDFTVNAMAYHPLSGIEDPFGGKKDLRDRIIRCVGSPDERFNEDALRIMRALRFASTYAFSIDDSTSVSILNNRQLLSNIAVERISAEFNRLLCGEGAEAVLNEYRDVFAVFIPELSESFDFAQNNKHHNLDVYRHITHSVASISPEPLLRATMLFHDIGKPRACTEDADGTRHFKGHQQISTDMARAVYNRLKYPNEFKENSLLLILYHDVRYNGTKKQLRRLINKLGTENMRRLFKVQMADTLSQSEYMRREKISSIETAISQFEELMNENACFSLKQLAVNGRDIISLGVTDGRQIGATLKALLEFVLDEKVENKKAALLKAAENMIK